jgi:hypothetical protein
MIITDAKIGRHMRINLEIAAELHTLFKRKLITQSAMNLIWVILANNWTTGIPIQKSKPEWIKLADINSANFYRDFKCLKDYGIWKKIGAYYVVNPVFLFSGSVSLQEMAAEAWKDGRLFTSTDYGRFGAKVRESKRDSNEGVRKQLKADKKRKSHPSPPQSR